MPRIYHQMKYDTKDNKYIISKYAPGKNIDTTKMESIIEIKKNLWAARSKQILIDYAEEMKAEKISEYQNMIRRVSKRKILM